MSLIRLQDVTIAFGSQPVLESISLVIGSNTRTAVVGRNGEGKSTLLKLLAGSIDSDSGEVSRRSSLKTAYLPQSVPIDLHGSVYTIVASGLTGVGELLARYHTTSINFAQGKASAEQLGRLQDEIDSRDGWSLGQRVEQTLTRMSLDADTDVSTLSGGLKRRVLLAKALILQPDLLLLDEPTNHLDIGSIDWLEQYLKTLNCSLVFITHDRSFLDAVAQHIVELDRGKLTEWPGSYKIYRSRKQEMLEVEADQNALFDKKLAQEETWIRQGIKARRTRNEGRVRALKALREQSRQRRNLSGNAKLSANQAEHSGKLVFEAQNVDFAFEKTIVVRNLNITVQRKDRLGIIGPNGCGKSTLVSLLLGSLGPTSGKIHHGTQLKIAYFDQLRTALDTQLSAADNVSGGKDTVAVNGSERHIMSYMQDFLFAPDRARAPIDALSGGETNRLMLAKLFLQPSNVLILDEPSNDLDVETLELLEALLAKYAGTVILISHDRELLDNTVTRSLVYQGNGRFVDIIGGYADFERELAASNVLTPIFENSVNGRFNNKTPTTTSENARTNIDGGQYKLPSKTSTDSAKPARLGYKLQRELDALPSKISELEQSVAALHKSMSVSGFYTDSEKSAQIINQAEQLQNNLDEAYRRWDKLETLASMD